MTGGCATATTIGALLCEGGEVLRAAGVEEARRESRLLLALALGRDAAGLLAAARDPVAAADAARFRALLRRRAAREPFAHIAGRRGFWTLELAVSPAVLVPRPETETLVEAALAVRPDRHAVRRIVDLGTGSGALLLAALAEYPEAIGLGVDRSAAALDIARHNAAAAGLAVRARFVLGDWSSALAPSSVDLLLCNPPYLPTAEIASLAPEVRDHEPRAALDGGPDGLSAYRALLPDLPRVLAPRGVAIVEVGIGQADTIAALGVAAGLGLLEMRQDLGGIPRAIAFGNAEKGVGDGALSD
ncbi:MAG: peptide chain release factor N(5)-glutamine methyltransferase [Elioraea sp.]|nr:peptide chain release factor N(5)-glutamine methyltransferase [Elioraea sp.]